jgi:molybdate transport system substrate-binding protein
MKRRLLAFVACLGLAWACTASGTGSPTFTASASPAAVVPRSSSVGVDLTVYAATSLKDAMAAVKSAYEAAVPGTTLTVATDSSATLRAQIEQGAPADLLLSADQKNPQALADGGLADGTAVDFASIELTIIVPADNPAAIASPADLAKSGVKIVAAGDEVPITSYATQAVANLAALAGYPANFERAYAANVVSREENVKAVVAKIELGEGDAAIVYVTDARSSTGIKTIEVPAEANVMATYAGVAVKASHHAREAHALLDWLAGPEGFAILTTFGFRPPS